MSIFSYHDYLSQIKQPEQTMAFINSISYLKDHKAEIEALFEQGQSLQGSKIKLTLPLQIKFDLSQFDNKAALSTFLQNLIESQDYLAQKNDPEAILTFLQAVEEAEGKELYNKFKKALMLIDASKHANKLIEKEANSSLEKLKPVSKEADAATTIQRMWRKNGFFNHFYLQLLAIKDEQLVESKTQNKVLQAINNAVKRKDREGLRMIAYAVLGSRDYLKGFGLYLIRYNLLSFIFLDKDASINLIAKVLEDTCRHAFEEAKERSRTALEQKPIDRSTYWGQNNNVSPEKLHYIISGGGYYFQRDFLQGRTPGYPLEYNGLGIQVTPSEVDDIGEGVSYAYKAYKHFDKPCCFVGKTAAQYITKANNGYEGGLRPENIPNLIGYQLNVQPEFHQRARQERSREIATFNYENIIKLYKHDRDTCKELIASMDRLVAGNLISAVNRDKVTYSPSTAKTW